ncbi:MinD/ParA family protein [Carboxydothermus pertinax]|uniref:Flagellar biosynthesis protein n=1 Tax=Carboxydothermus pertinax TaxID=870242 RepID=A0A1L8CUI4_9THEO|nr:MinD/ParA family protein [Carboxydothermus pertinax]GAV22578.1 flagellar biosynthesis protein [Carboxydothermus pertinax]
MYQQAFGLIKNKSENGLNASSQRIIAVTSGKGGVGKSNFVANLALALADLAKKVLILDADLGLANVELLFGVTPQCTLLDYLNSEKEVNDLITPLKSNVDLISGGAGLLELTTLTVKQRKKIIQLIENLPQNYDIILIDTGAGINKEVMSFVAAAREVILIITPEPTSITDAYTMLKMLARHQLNQKIYLVVNRVRDEKEGEKIAERILLAANKYLNLHPEKLGFLVEDRNLPEAVRQMKPCYWKFPNSLVTKNLKGIARKLTTETLTEQKNDNFAGFFTKLLRIFG